MGTTKKVMTPVSVTESAKSLQDLKMARCRDGDQLITWIQLLQSKILKGCGWNARCLTTFIKFAKNVGLYFCAQFTKFTIFTALAWQRMNNICHFFEFANIYIIKAESSVATYPSPYDPPPPHHHHAPHGHADQSCMTNQKTLFSTWRLYCLFCFHSNHFKLWSP